ncbi:hypothetical protein EA772_11880 [Pedobacter sp. G11]|uniref:sensor histidine kinase n=1 Tax=Pedobacter sp. G11 TaxID=2482728 RepID=UPI000F5D89CF|nr:ATP-binding protein [Pedobacter sp. G11]AZI26009.1 hypothetical protein EA772_11880 [Pedobacter sp. G11]RYF26176.1 MAG: hypothetical protein EOO42_02180 [Flavobacteriales bacterium]
MLYNFDIDDLIPLFAIGAILIIAIYHTILYAFSKLKLVGGYTIYLWLGLAYLVLATTMVPSKTFKVPSLQYLISSGVFWLSLLAYLNFLVLVIGIPKNKETRIYVMAKRTYLITPVYFALRFPYFFFPIEYVQMAKTVGLLMDGYFFFIFGYLIYQLFINKERDVKNYVFIGSILIVGFNIFTSLSYYTQGYIFGLSHVSFIALGFFSDIIFFSLAVGWQIRESIKERYRAQAEVSQKEFAIESEKKKASDILLMQDHQLENEKAQAIIQQRAAIGRKLHDDLGGNLVALRYYIEDKLKKASSENEFKNLLEIDQEIQSIYKETRDYSHLLSGIRTEKEENYYNIDLYLETMKQRFSNFNFFAIETIYNKDEVNRYLSPKVSEQIYYLLKESLSNVIKHAKASHVSISIIFMPDHFSVEIKDNGKGMTNNEINGLGLQNLRTGLHLINGQLMIMSNPAGTIVNATVPLMPFNESDLEKTALV